MLTAASTDNEHAEVRLHIRTLKTWTIWNPSCRPPLTINSYLNTAATGCRQPTKTTRDKASLLEAGCETPDHVHHLLCYLSPRLPLHQHWSEQWQTYCASHAPTAKYWSTACRYAELGNWLLSAHYAATTVCRCWTSTAAATCSWCTSA